VGKWQRPGSFSTQREPIISTGAFDASKISYNLRYPGQYYDQETGLSYNYFRDYDPPVHCSPVLEC
jgi:RHS repeat-associated protein